MSSIITVERIEKKQTLIEVAADTPQEAFNQVNKGQGHEVGTVKKSELLIRGQEDETAPPKPAR